MDPRLQEYIPKIREGNAAAFRDLFYAAKDPLFGYACKLCRSRELAEEVVQEVFMKLWINRQHLDETLSIKSYLYTATKHCVFNLLKKAALDETLRQAVFHRQPVAVNTTEEDISLAELQQWKAKVLEQLPPQRRLIYSMSRIEGLSHEEIAAKLGLSKNTVKDQIVKAGRFLRTQFHTHYDVHDVIIPLLIFTSYQLAVSGCQPVCG
ncbi:RNA polymerase sigma-70 factor [Chitinophaga japonensis]|uniref:RNA polymerase sigma-70 factor (ECF subfamily) n=1 Tax=Chitinophaga japonensis TaxID=104662 RepID=A0A562TB81_CHIJA|nr:RNA polymerase sigma-70 factor [Chitinophaga japonensis]TWI90839.1 RNA polymerase sigma-70 factor (ECF subfamily) [Chitinophaga japonensis]